MATTGKTKKTYIVKVDNRDVRVRATSHAEARRLARAGKGRVVGVYLN